MCRALGVRWDADRLSDVCCKPPALPTYGSILTLIVRASFCRLPNLSAACFPYRPTPASVNGHLSTSQKDLSCEPTLDFCSRFRHASPADLGQYSIKRNFNIPSA